MLWKVVMAFWWMMMRLSLSEAMNCPTSELEEDAMSLLSLKRSISEDPLNLLKNWNPCTNHCNNWYGVECDGVSGRVIGIKITQFISGTLSPSIGNLTALRTLYIPHNLFSGEIPHEISNIHSLEILEIQGNNFSGPIPYQLVTLTSLRLVNLSYNKLSGPIPDGLIGFGNLSVLDLSNNHLSGGIGIQQFGECLSLNLLKLSNNFFVGNIPTQFGNKCSNLTTLLLDGNIFQGQIPPDLGLISELRFLDVSRNSLTHRIPKELANCHKLSALVLTNLFEFDSEFNAFVGGIPHQLFLLPNLQLFWAPRANLGGRLPANWTHLCSLRVLNLGQNYLTNVLPESIVMCKNLTFLDLSSNHLLGYLPPQLQVPCMVYFNVSRNMLSGALPTFFGNANANANASFCDNGGGMITSTTTYGGLLRLDVEDSIENNNAYAYPIWGYLVNTLFGSTLSLDDTHNLSLVVAHDFSWNGFVGSLPLISFGDGPTTGGKTSYEILFNNNKFNESLPGRLLSKCGNLQSVSVNLSANQIYGTISPELLRGCSSLTVFEAAGNQIGGLIPPEMGSLKMLQYLDLSRNRLSGSLPIQLGELKDLKQISLSDNNLTGEIPAQLGQLTSLMVLALSLNSFTGPIPAALASATNLETLLLDRNILSGEIPSSFSTLSNLTKLDLSFNNLSGHIPHLQHIISDCDCFEGNKFLHSSYPDSNSASPAGLAVPLEVQKLHNDRKFKSFIIAMSSTSASVVVCILGVIVLVLVLGRRKLSRITTLRRKVMVTFADAPADLNYDNVVRATGNFSISNLIGTGGFGSTYKAELVQGFLVAVKRLSIGRFQGIQQFDAEIRTLGRIRHRNLVTLVGYYVGEDEMFLVYNYLSGGNLETFLHDRSSNNVKWPVIHKIAIDIAQALAFLHYSCVPRIVHRDIKPSNILLDEQLNAYLSDFGLARLLEVSETHATTDVAGTFGYVAPEYATTCRVSNKADVYSFGVVLLELMSGKKSLDPSFSEYGNGFNIVAWAKLLIQEGRSSELLSPELWEAGPQENLLGMLRLASTCTVETLSVRPSMKQVLEKLKQLKS